MVDHDQLVFKQTGVNTLSCHQGFRVVKFVDKPEDRPAKTMFEAWNKGTLINTVSSGAHARRLCVEAFEASRCK